MPGMEHHPSGHPRNPPVLDMTLDGQFRGAPEAPLRRRTWLDRALGKVSGLALLVALGAGGLLLAALAVLAVSLLLPVVLIAAVIGAGTLYWKLRRAGLTGQRLRFVVVRR
jgi:hypothetical protein